MRGCGETVPLTMAQEPVWLEQLRHPEQVNAGFFVVTMSGTVEADAVAGACAEVCRNHPELRGTIVDQDNRYWFRINDAETVFEIEYPIVPCAPGAENETARAWYLARRPLTWDLTSRAPIRFFLLDHGDERRTLVIAVHHIAFDGRSKFVFARQFVSALREIRAGVRPAAAVEAVAPLAGSDDLDKAGLAAATTYWQGHDLRTFPSLVLPAPSRVDPVSSMAATSRFELPEQRLRRLAALTTEAGTSFFSGLLAVTAAQLGRYGNDRFALCIPADTSTAATRERIAMQVNMVPCVIEHAPRAGLRDLVTTAGRALADIDRFRRVPFHLLMRELRQSYGVDIGPSIFDRFGVSYPRVAADFGEVPGLVLDWDFFAPNSSQSFQVTLQLRKTPEGVFGRLDYATSVFDAETAEDFVSGWHETLERALADPDEPLSRRSGSPGCPLPVAPVPKFEAGTMIVPVDRFLPTEDRVAFVNSGGRIVLVLDDDRAGPIAWGEWEPAPDVPDGALILAHNTGNWRPIVVAHDGRELPARVPGTLVLRPRDGGPDLETEIRARIDPKGRLHYLGLAGQAADFGGRHLEGAEAERRIAALPGVREVAVVPGADASRPAPGILLVPDGTAESDPASERTWRRKVLRVWPPGAPRPTEVVLTERLPRDRTGRVDLARVRSICLDATSPSTADIP